MNSIRAFAFLLTIAALTGCGTIPVDERDEVREQVDLAAEQTIARLTDTYPEFAQAFDESVGFIAARASSAVAMVGGSVGLGVLVDREADTRTYMNVSRVDLGIGVGAGSYSAVLLFESREAFDTFRSGVWRSGIGIESAAGESGGSTRSSFGKDTALFAVSETGATLTATARLTRVSVNTELTNTGVSSVGVPNTGFDVGERQTEHAPRQWTHRLPFMAQKVIDLGYDLPLPYGIGLTYANVDQAMFLNELEVGINGADLEPFTFVDFQNARAVNDTIQLKVDAWLFPFMNVFGLVGRIDGKAPMDIFLDGNGMLDQLGTDCSGIIRPPLCILLEDQVFLLPIEAPFSGTTYGIGTVLAGGWNNWFVVLPFSFTYADMDTTKTDGIATTITPRLGRTFDLGRKGVISLFVGGNYLDAEISVLGQVSTPDGLLTIDYAIEQENVDRWNALIGGNWDISRRVSLMAEYNGFTGSRDAFIASLVYRF